VSSSGYAAAPLPLGLALRSFRADRNMSQKAFGASIRRSNSLIGRWERGLDEPTIGDLPECDLALGLPIGTLLTYHSGSPLRRDIETFTLRSLLDGAADLVTTAVHESVRIGTRGLYRVDVQQRSHAIRRGVASYWVVYAQGEGQPTVRVEPLSGCTVESWPRLLTAGRVAQELKLGGGPMQIGEERVFRFRIRYDDRDNPEQEAGLHRRVGTPTLAWLKMQVLLPPGGALIKQATWLDRCAPPIAEAVHLLRQEQKLLHWDRPTDHTYGFAYWLTS
jgi:transcriptional regulator with XRE-family HTH domain